MKRVRPRNTPRPGATQPGDEVRSSVEISAEAQRKIRRHARSSMRAEICGVLIGSMQPGCTVVDEIIAGEGALQAGTHVTFTQETWAHIYEVKDAKYPDSRIVGWYHSHPGFGIFLSDHDLFIHRNFFSDPNQIAWVFDPRSDEEGCFVWKNDEVVRLERLAVKTMQTKSPVTVEDQSADNSYIAVPGADEPQENEPQRVRRSSPSLRSRLLRWCVLVASHLAILFAGLLVGMLMGTQVVIVSKPEPAASVLKTTTPQVKPDADASAKEKHP